MKPLRNNVLVAQIKEERNTESGIILTGPDVASKNGKVLAIGPDVEYVSVGETVVPDWSKGNPTTVDGIQCVIISEENILAVIE
jgi:co-chaperonin GroES (HSP10)